MSMQNVTRVVGAVALCLAVGFCAPPDEFGSSAAAAEANAFVEAQKEPDGGRFGAALVYAPHLKKFVLAGGLAPGKYGRHYDTEEYDLAGNEWANAYPKGGEQGRPASGLIKGFDNDERHGMWIKEGDKLRPSSWDYGYAGDTRWYRQWCYAPDRKTLYAYVRSTFGSYDVDKREWTDIGKPYGRGTRLGGALGYDPVNREVVAFGGASGEAAGGSDTWLFGVEAGEWRKAEPGSAAHRKLSSEAEELQAESWALLSAARNRFWIADTEEEAKADLSARCSKLADALAALAGECGKLGAADIDPETAKRGAAALREGGEAVKASAGKLKTVTKDVLSELGEAQRKVEGAAETVAAQPRPRCDSQLACDPEHGCLVLFGGNAQDRALSDTWLYEFKGRRWVQRWPERAPSPRGGHALVYLPKSGKVALAGGFTLGGSYKAVPFELWTYDVDANSWSNLLHVPLQNAKSDSYSPGVPGGNANEPWLGAADDEDVLVMVANSGKGRSTWTCRVDPGRADATATAAHGVAPGAVAWSWRPEDWERVAEPDAAKTRAFYDGLVPNVWTLVPTPKNVPGATNRWGTTFYDPDRGQLMLWGGGHSTSCYPDMAHFSTRSGLWSEAYPIEQPQDPVNRWPSAAAWTPKGVRNVPLHVWRGADYAGGGYLATTDSVYNVVERRWEPAAFPGLKSDGYLKTVVKYTPHGAVAWSKHGLYVFKVAEKQWAELLTAGVPPAYGDGDGLTYDSKRDCLWASSGAKGLLRFDFQAGKLSSAGGKPTMVGKWGPLCSESAHVPEADVIVAMNVFKDADGGPANLVFDPEQMKYFTMPAVFSSGGKPAKAPSFSWHDGIAYDVKTGRLFINECGKNVWVMKFDKAGAKLTEAK